MDHPFFLPHPGRHGSKQRRLFQFMTKLGAKDHGDSFDRNEEIGAGKLPTTIISKSAAGDDEMQVRMIDELAGPGVQHADQAQTSTDEARVLSQLEQSV